MKEVKNKFDITIGWEWPGSGLSVHQRVGDPCNFYWTCRALGVFGEVLCARPFPGPLTGEEVNRAVAAKIQKVINEREREQMRVLGLVAII